MKAHHKSVIIASDDLVIMNQVTSILKRYNYSIFLVTSSFQLLAEILQKNTQFIVLDVDISVDLVSELIHRVKEIRPHLPIVVLANDNSPTTMGPIAEAGVFYCALKPLRAGEIEKVVEAIDKYEYSKRNNVTF